jgi:outer membrane immunogenic protein
MKQVVTLTSALFASCLLTLTTFAGPESLPSGKEMKEVAPAPLPECNWTGFYLGVTAGGQFGHSEDFDLDDYWNHPGWGYRESGAIMGGEFGYNLQIGRWLVLGPEFDAGYMDLKGHGEDPGTNSFGGPNFGESNSDFYTTLRGRIGVPLDWHGCWLIYATGGGIGVNYYTKDYDPNENFVGSRTDFEWGYTVGGGIERKIGTRWSIKVEYLYFDLDTQHFTGHSPTYEPQNTFRFDGETAGNIVRVGLNFHF